MVTVGLISDTHIPESRSQLWPEVYEAFADVDLILHGGDLHVLDVLDELEEIAPVYAARGNGDKGSSGRPVVPEDPRLKEVWQLDVEDHSIGLVHIMPLERRNTGVWDRHQALEEYFDWDVDVVIYGDTHVAAVENKDDILFVNPGSPTYPHNLRTQRGTIGFLELNEHSEPEASIWKLTEDDLRPFSFEPRQAFRYE